MSQNKNKTQASLTIKGWISSYIMIQEDVSLYPTRKNKNKTLLFSDNKKVRFVVYYEIKKIKIKRCSL